VDTGYASTVMTTIKRLVVHRARTELVARGSVDQQASLDPTQPITDKRMSE